MNGMCSTTGVCPPGFSDCSGQCVNTNDDPNNCGACGTVCAPGDACNNGACAGCPPTAPIAVAIGRTLGNPVMGSNTFDTPPLTTIELDGRGSSSPSGSVLNYQWAVIQSPPSFFNTFQPSATVERPTLQLTSIGVYVLELTVTDSQGRASCTPALVTISTRSTERLAVELTWNTPADLNPADTNGTDLDLYVRFNDPNQTWNTAAVFYANRTPSWGPTGGGATTLDDPRFLRDDTDGVGPEVIAIEEPAPTLGANAFYSGPYQVGVHYFSDRGLGPSLPRIRVFSEGGTTPLVDWPTIPRTLPSTDTFWFAGELDWTPMGVMNLVEIDTVRQGVP